MGRTQLATQWRLSASKALTSRSALFFPMVALPRVFGPPSNTVSSEVQGRVLETSKPRCPQICVECAKDRSLPASTYRLVTRSSYALSPPVIHGSHSSFLGRHALVPLAC